MDHAIDSIKTYFEISLEELYKEWTSGQYKSFTSCPTHAECEAYRKAINVLKAHYYGSQFEPMTLKEHIETHIWISKNDK